MHQQLERAVEQCGVPGNDARITYEDYLQSEQIVIRSRALADGQVECIRQMSRAAPYPIVLFEDVRLRTRAFDQERKQGRLDAAEWLRSRDMLKSLPVYDPRSETVGRYAQRIETFCGIAPGSMLKPVETYAITIKSEWVEAELANAGTQLQKQQSTCVTNALAASNIEDHDVRFVILGNAAYVPDGQTGEALNTK